MDREHTHTQTTRSIAAMAHVKEIIKHLKHNFWQFFDFFYFSLFFFFRQFHAWSISVDACCVRSSASSCPECQCKLNAAALWATSTFVLAHQMHCKKMIITANHTICKMHTNAMHILLGRQYTYITTWIALRATNNYAICGLRTNVCLSDVWTRQKRWLKIRQDAHEQTMEISEKNCIWIEWMIGSNCIVPYLFTPRHFAVDDRTQTSECIFENHITTDEKSICARCAPISDGEH